MQTLYLQGGARLRASSARPRRSPDARPEQLARRLPSGQVDPHEVHELASAMDEPGERAAGGAMGEVELDLDHADGRRGRRRWSSRSPCRTRGRAAARPRARARAALAVRRGGPSSPGRSAGGSPSGRRRARARRRHPTRLAKAATATSASPRPTASASATQLARGVREVAVAENEYRLMVGVARGHPGPAQGLSGGAGDGGALADHPRAAHDPRTGVPGDLGGGVARAVVGHPDLRARERLLASAASVAAMRSASL